MIAIVRRFLPLALILAISACQKPLPEQPPEIGFTRYQPIYMDVAKIDIIDEYQSPMKTPNVEHLLPVSPAEAMHIWVRDRLRAVGNARSLQVVIKDASVTVTALPKQSFLTVSQDRRYDGRLDVEMRIYNGGAMSEANVEAIVTRSVTVNEKASVVERQAIFRRMIFDMMEEMNSELEKQMFTYFGNYINYSQRW